MRLAKDWFRTIATIISLLVLFRDYCEQGISFVVLHSKQFMQQIHMLKNSKKPSYIDPLLPNSPRSFQNTPAIRTDLSYFHRLCNNSFRNALFACTIKLFVLLYRLIIVLISHEFLYTINGK